LNSPELVLFGFVTEALADACELAVEFPRVEVLWTDAETLLNFPELVLLGFADADALRDDVAFIGTVVALNPETSPWALGAANHQRVVTPTGNV